MPNEDIILGPIAGAVTHKSAKIWFYGRTETENPTKYFCHVSLKDGNRKIPSSPFEFKEVSESFYEYEGFKYKAHLSEIQFPAQGEEFVFNITKDREDADERAEKHLIKKFPKDGDVNFSFGLISCHKALFGYTNKVGHKPYEKIVPKMWKSLYDKMQSHKSSFLIQAGDQVYCDNSVGKVNGKGVYDAWEKSKTTDDQEEMLGYYRRVYMLGWQYPDVQKVMRTFPQYMIWDDHEITNGFGSKNDHKDYKSTIFQAAKKAYIEFQHSHNPDALKEGELYYAFNYGNAAFLVLDLRGHRDVTKSEKERPLLGKEQWDEVKKWIDSDKVKKSKLLFVVTSVPVVHITRAISSLGFLKSDIRDQWSTEKNKAERRTLLNMLHRWSGEENKPVVILGGDVHVGTECCIIEDKEDNPKTIYQVTSSPITNKPAWFLDLFLAPFTKKIHFHLAEQKQKPMRAILKRHRRRNFAVIEVDYGDKVHPVKLNMYKGSKDKVVKSEFGFGANSDCKKNR
jgi:alkaline phosphatase D